MIKSAKTLLAATALVVGFAAVSILYADDSHRSHGSSGTSERMGNGGTMNHQGGMMGGGGMMGMGNMMGRMSQMMDGCNQMMQGAMGGSGSPRPNDQWRQEAPRSPGQDG